MQEVWNTTRYSVAIVTLMMLVRLPGNRGLIRRFFSHVVRAFHSLLCVCWGADDAVRENPEYAVGRLGLTGTTVKLTWWKKIRNPRFWCWFFAGKGGKEKVRNISTKSLWGCTHEDSIKEAEQLVAELEAGQLSWFGRIFHLNHPKPDETQEGFDSSYPRFDCQSKYLLVSSFSWSSFLVLGSRSAKCSNH